MLHSTIYPLAYTCREGSVQSGHWLTVSTQRSYAVSIHCPAPSASVRLVRLIVKIDDVVHSFEIESSRDVTRTDGRTAIAGDRFNPPSERAVPARSIRSRPGPARQAASHNQSTEQASVSYVIWIELAFECPSVCPSVRPPRPVGRSRATWRPRLPVPLVQSANRAAVSTSGNRASNF